MTAVDVMWHLLRCSRCGWERYAPAGTSLTVTHIGDRCLFHAISVPIQRPEFIGGISS